MASKWPGRPDSVGGRVMALAASENGSDSKKALRICWNRNTSATAATTKLADLFKRAKVNDNSEGPAQEVSGAAA